MPHYADGTEAKIGDLVKGRGYNEKQEIIGKVVNVRPGDSCTLSVAHVGVNSQIFFGGPDHNAPFASVFVQASIEYGDTKGFEKIA